MAVWQTMTLEDLFPGMKQSVDELNQKIGDFLQKTQSIQAQIAEKVNALQDMAQQIGSLAEDLTASGFYVCFLDPEQGWTTRLINAENAPPDDVICAGVCILTCVPDFEEAASNFQKLMNILTKPISVP